MHTESFLAESARYCSFVFTLPVLHPIALTGAMKGQGKAKHQRPAARSPDKKKKSKKKSRADKLAAVAAAAVPRQDQMVDYEPSEADAEGGAEGEATDEAEHGEAGAGDHADGGDVDEAEEEEPGEPEPDSDDAKSDISMEEQMDMAILGGDTSKLSKGLLTEAAQRMAARAASRRHTVHELRAVNKHAIRKSKPAANLTSLKLAAELAKFLPKPSTFSGAASANFRSWKQEVETYLNALSLPPITEVAVVKGLLRAEALNWWTLKQQHLSKNNEPLPASWSDMVKHLNTRFDHANPELQALNQLQVLKQGSLSVHAYIKAFEGCYVHISDYTETDKIFRFLWGLNPEEKKRFSVNPNTNQRWSTFDSLVSYITSFVSDATTSPGHAGTLLGEVKPPRRQLTAVRNNRRPAGRPNNNPRTKYGSPAKVSTYTNAKGAPVTRNHHVRSYCHERGLCLGCYGTGHRVADCTEPVKGGAPEGYKPPTGNQR